MDPETFSHAQFAQQVELGMEKEDAQGANAVVDEYSEAKLEVPETAGSRKRKVDEVDCGVKPVSRFGHVADVNTASGGELRVKIQTDSYYPFSKRCMKIMRTTRLPKLGKNLAHGYFMFQLSKRDYKEEFELLPRCGQKIGSHSDTEAWKMDRRLSKIYHTNRDAYDCPRYLELWLSELGKDITVPISAELDWYSGCVSTPHLSLGSFGRYFGEIYQEDYSHTLMKRLNPYEGFFLADCGTLEITGSHVPLGVEDIRAILEANVRGFMRRYTAFSELQRTTRYSIKMYEHEKTITRFVQPPPPSCMRYAMGIAGGHSFADKLEDQLVPQYSDGYCNQKTVDIAPSKPAHGFASHMSRNTQQARQLLSLPGGDAGLNCVTATVGATSTIDSASAPIFVPGRCGFVGQNFLHGSKRGQSYRNNSDTRGIDIAFYGCEKSKEETFPAFDVAITNYGDDTVHMSALFSVMETKKNPSIPLLMERYDYGQLSGYSMILARIPEVEYSGREKRMPKMRILSGAGQPQESLKPSRPYLAPSFVQVAEVVQQPISLVGQRLCDELPESEPTVKTGSPSKWVPGLLSKYQYRDVLVDMRTKEVIVA